MTFQLIFVWIDCCLILEKPRGSVVLYIPFTGCEIGLLSSGSFPSGSGLPRISIGMVSRFGGRRLLHQGLGRIRGGLLRVDLTPERSTVTRIHKGNPPPSRLCRIGPWSRPPGSLTLLSGPGLFSCKRASDLRNCRKWRREKGADNY
jgi:hypothetical protein